MPAVGLALMHVADTGGTHGYSSAGLPLCRWIGHFTMWMMTLHGVLCYILWAFEPGTKCAFLYLACAALGLLSLHHCACMIMVMIVLHFGDCDAQPSSQGRRPRVSTARQPLLLYMPQMNVFAALCAASGPSFRPGRTASRSCPAPWLGFSACRCGSRRCTSAAAVCSRCNLSTVAIIIPYIYNLTAMCYQMTTAKII